MGPRGKLLGIGWSSGPRMPTGRGMGCLLKANHHFPAASGTRRALLHSNMLAGCEGIFTRLGFLSLFVAIHVSPILYHYPTQFAQAAEPLCYGSDLALKLSASVSESHPPGDEVASYSAARERCFHATPAVLSLSPFGRGRAALCLSRLFAAKRFAVRRYVECARQVSRSVRDYRSPGRECDWGAGGACPSHDCGRADRSLAASSNRLPGAKLQETPMRLRGEGCRIEA